MTAASPAPPHEGNWYVLVAGKLESRGPLTLAPGVSLVPLASPLTIFDLAASGAAGFREWAVLEPMCSSCTCEIETAKDADVLPGYDALNRAWLAAALLVLRGFHRLLPLACSSYSWSTIAGHQERTTGTFRTQLATEGIEAAVFRPKRELPPFVGGLLDYHTQFLVAQGLRDGEVSQDDATWIYSSFDIANRLASESDSFRLALESATDWRYTKEPRVAIGRIWAGIEALFGISSELVYRISGLCASLLEERGASRVKRFRETKRLYGLRSKAVHGESLPSDQLVSGINESYSLLRSLLVLTIDRGGVLSADDFDEALFG